MNPDARPPKVLYRIIENKERRIIIAQIYRWYWPFWRMLKGYTYLPGNREQSLNWCRQAIEEHRGGKKEKEPEWVEIE